MEVSCHRFKPGGRSYRTEWIRGYVGLRACLDRALREQTFAAAEDRVPVIQTTALSL
jgi:hypothetical protein